MRQLAIAFGVVMATASAASAQRTDSLTTAIDHVFENFRDTDGPGCAIGVSRGGKVVLERGFGMANLELGGSVYRVASTDSTLTFRTGTEDPFTARPMFADTFLGEGYTIQFTRTAGRVTGFEVTNARVRRVKFTRK